MALESLIIHTAARKVVTREGKNHLGLSSKLFLTSTPKMSPSPNGESQKTIQARPSMICRGL